jgi:FkbM family methyltransferase
MVLTELVKAILPKPMKRAITKLRFDLRNRRFRPYLKKKTVEGVTFDFWIGDPDGRDWYDITSTDPFWPEMRFVRDHLVTPGDVVLEIGAHHGCTAILLSRWVGDSGRVICFEPMPANCDVIRKNIALNKLTNVTLVPEAVGTGKGVVRIDGSSNSAVRNSRRGTEVAQTFVDAYADLRPTFLKIDVEGFEHQVLLGARNVLANRPKIALELHPDHLSQYGSSLEDIFALLGPLQYRMWLQREDTVDPVEYDGKAPIAKRAHLFCV